MTNIPVLVDLFNGVINSIQVAFNITIPTTGKNFFRALAGVWAGKLKTAYLKLANVQKNAWFDDADYPMLIRFGMTFLQRLPFAATQGQYTCTVTGTAGGTIDANTTFLSDPTSLSPGFLFILDTTFVLSGSSGTVTLRAVTPGTKANLSIADTLTCTKPLVNVSQVATVATISVSAIDAETTTEYRAAIDRQVRLAPQGGAVADYILWGGEAAGVKRIYPYTASGSAWEVDVYVEAVLSDSGGSAPDYNYGIPTSTILDDVTNDILTDPTTTKARKPMGVILGPSNIGAIAVTVYQLVITFTGTGTMTADEKTNITLALQQALANIRPFIGGGGNVADQNDTISLGLPATGGRTTAPEKYVVAVIAMNAAPGAIFTGVTMTVNAISETSYTFDNGIIGYLQATNVLFT